MGAQNTSPYWNLAGNIKATPVLQNWGLQNAINQFHDVFLNSHNPYQFTGVKKRSLYWRCQISGWGAYITFSTVFYTSMPGSLWYFFRLLLLAAIVGIFITHVMRLFIIKAGLLQLNKIRQVLYMVLTTILFSFIYAVIVILLGYILNWGQELINFFPNKGNVGLILINITYSNFFFLSIWNLVYFSYHYLKKSQREQIERIHFENELKIQKLESQKHLTELEVRAQAAQIKAMVATQEQERKRISRDLHDDIGTKLSALRLFLSVLHEKSSNTNNGEIESLAQSSGQLIKETIQDVRQLLQNLSPAVLEEFGYTTAVEGLVDKINEVKQIHFSLVVFGMKDRLKKDYELALYRITQELINNILKHAEAKNVSLQIGYRDEKIILMMEDDGKGFDVDTHKDGYGLKNLEARSKLMRGTMIIDSKAGKGTSVLIEIPYNFNGV